MVEAGGLYHETTTVSDHTTRIGMIATPTATSDDPRPHADAALRMVKHRRNDLGRLGGECANSSSAKIAAGRLRERTEADTTIRTPETVGGETVTTGGSPTDTSATVRLSGLASMEATATATARTTAPRTTTAAVEVRAHEDRARQRLEVRPVAKSSWRGCRRT